MNTCMKYIHLAPDGYPLISIRPKPTSKSAVNLSGPHTDEEAEAAFAEALRLFKLHKLRRANSDGFCPRKLPVEFENLPKIGAGKAWRAEPFGDTCVILYKPRVKRKLVKFVAVAPVNLLEDLS
jgi:hypothetical protein